MFKISKPVEYALIALRHMDQGESGNSTAVREICERHNTPFDVTSRALQHLARHGVVRAERGVAGGYRLVRDLSDLSFHDLLEFVEGPLRVVPCLDQSRSCKCGPGQDCSILPPMLKLNDRLDDFLKTLSVSDLFSTEAANC